MLKSDGAGSGRRNLASTMVAPDLVHKDGEDVGRALPQDMIIELNLDYRGGRSAARARVSGFLDQAARGAKNGWTGRGTICSPP